MTDRVYWSRPSSPDFVGIDYGTADRTVYHVRQGAEFIAAFDTPEEAIAAMELLAMPVQGNA